MGHWRDGGIGNMPGSDDRPYAEWTLLEKLARVIEYPPSSGVGDIAQEAFDEIQRQRETIERYEKILRIISGSTDLLIATQAAGALTNIGAKV